MRTRTIIIFLLAIGWQPLYISAQKAVSPDTLKCTKTSLYMELGGSGYVASIGASFNIIEKNHIMFYNSILLSTHAFVPHLDKNIGLNYGIGVRLGKKVFVGFQTNVVGYYSLFLDANNKNIDNGIFYGSYSHQLPIGFKIKHKIEFIVLPTLIHPFNKVRYYPYLGFGINLLFYKRLQNEKH